MNRGDALSPSNLATDFTVTLVDGAGTSFNTTVSANTGALFYPPGTVGPVRKLFLNTVRIPLSAFAPINVSTVQSVIFKFNQRTSGAVVVSDIAFVK